jgi:hypothetical protein
MRTLSVIIAAILLITPQLWAQVPAAASQNAPAPPTCPPSGYSPPFYALFGQNGGDGQTATEIASPCIGPEVRKAAEDIGMGRNALLGVKNIITVMFTADGMMADADGMSTLNQAEFHLAYYVPAMRMFLNGTGASGAPMKEIRVFADEYAWNEAEEGRGATPAMNTLNDRMPLLKLTPFGALWSVIDAEGHTTVTTVNSRTVLTGTSPYDGIEVSVTLEDQHNTLTSYTEADTMSLPVEVTATVNGHVYGATFADYRDTWESEYWVVFPSQITWTLDGQPLADLTVTAFKSNPYVVFPVPDVVR